MKRRQNYSLKGLRPETREGSTRFGIFFEKNSEACLLAERMCQCLFVSRCNLPRKEARKWAAALAAVSSEFLEMVWTASESGDASALRVFADAVPLVNRPVDPKRSFANWLGNVAPGRMRMTPARVAEATGVSVDQARRFFRELEMKRKPNKGGRPKGT